MSKVTIMIPALNEEQRIGATLDTVLSTATCLPGLLFDILVIDDGSQDNTAQIVTEYTERFPFVRLIRHPVNRGLGQAFQTALAQARGEKFLIVPGDNDMPSNTLRALLANSDAADMIMCFFLNREQRGRMRNGLSTLFALVYSTAFDLYVQYINGPCLYPVAQLRELSLISTRFSIVAEINVKLLRQGLSFCEVPSYRQTGMAGSTSFSLRNLAETFSVFCQLLYEVHCKNSDLYSRRPVRVTPEFNPSSSSHTVRSSI